MTPETEQPRDIRHMATQKASGFCELVKTIVYAVLIAVVVRTFLFEPFSIPSGSMIPTLLVGDYLFVSKFSYGYSRYSLPFGLPLFSGRIWSSTRRSAATSSSSSCRRDNTTDYIKRVIGLPGDRIQMIGGILQHQRRAGAPRAGGRVRPSATASASRSTTATSRRCRTAASTRSSRSATTARSTTPTSTRCRTVTIS